jgi:Tfp pilus assembly PilM family ATPase
MGRFVGTTICLDAFSVKVIIKASGHHQTRPLTSSVELPEGLFGADQILSHTILGEAIAAACRQAGIRPGRAAVVLPPTAAVVRPLQLPRLRPVELREAISWEMARYLPHPIDASIFTHQILNPTAPSSDPLEVMVAAAPTGIIAGIGDALRHAGMTATIITPRPWGIAGALPHSGGDGWRLLVDVADAQLLVSLLEHRLVRLSRTLPWEARRIADNEGLSALATEIERSLHFALAQNPTCQGLDEILLISEHPPLEGLEAQLRTRITIPIASLSRRHLAIPQRAAGVEEVSVGDAWALALAHGAPRSPLDLRSALEQHQRRSTLLRPLAVVAPAVTVALLALVQLTGEARLENFKLELAPLELVHQHRATLQGEERVLRERLSSLEGEIGELLNAEELASDLHGALRSLSAILASSAAGALYFEELRLSRSPQASEAELVARARDVAGAARFLSALERDPSWDLGAPSLVHHPGETSASVALSALRRTEASP